MTIGESIKKIRKKKGITQKELANLTGLAEATIIRYEKNKFKPNLKQMERIAVALNVAPVDIVGFSYWDEKYDSKKLASESSAYDTIISTFGDDVADTLHDFLSLNDEGQQKVRDYIDDLTEITKYKK